MAHLYQISENPDGKLAVIVEQLRINCCLLASNCGLLNLLEVMRCMLWRRSSNITQAVRSFTLASRSTTILISLPIT